MTGRHPDKGTTNSCPSGKLAYGTRAAAKRAANRARDRGEHCRPYACEPCGFFHVGHLPQATMYGKSSANAVYRKRGKAS